MSEIIKYNNIDLSKISYTGPTQNKNSYYGSIDYNNHNFMIQTSRLKVIDIKDKVIKVSVEPTDFSFYDTIIKLDDHNLASTYKHSKEWFKKELPMDVLENMYRRLSKPFKKDQIPILELRLSTKPDCHVYDTEDNIISLGELNVDSTILGIIDINGLKFLKRDYYCDICLSQIKICKELNINKQSKCLIEDNTEEDIYEYEILDEEVIHNNKQKEELKKKIIDTQKNIDNEQKSLLELQKKLRHLN
tara:strand:- start:1491 stop:2231 length:741 start_codon:yes stop_codon:yes gene_type:complete